MVAACGDAHSREELKEWNQRIEYKNKRKQRADRVCGAKSFVDLVIDKLSNAKNSETVRG